MDVSLTYPNNKTAAFTDYAYDLNGNLIKAGDTTYSYDALDRLTSVHKSCKIYDYTYDPFNRRISKKTATKTINYYWDGKNEVGSSQGDLRILGEGLGAEIGATALFVKHNWVYTPVHDHRGSIVTLLGDPTQVFRYTAFGEELFSNALIPWRFSSKRVDAETGFVYFGRRYYSPHLGRWVTPDPSGFTDGPNLYAYVHNAPLTSIDLYGLWGWRGAYSGVRNFGTGVLKHGWGMVSGVGIAAAQMGEWMVADSFYELGDPSYFRAKSQAAYDGWSAVGSAIRNEPLKTAGQVFVPGVMEAIHDPGSAENWGKAGVDVGMIATSIFKLGKIARVGRAGRVAEEVTALGKAGRAIREAALAEQFSLIEGKGSQIWTSTKKHTSVQNAYKHWKSHGQEFSSLQNSKQYVEVARNFVYNPPPGALKKVRPNGEILIYDPEFNIFGAYTSDSIPKTMFRPREGLSYWERN